MKVEILMFGQKTGDTQNPSVPGPVFRLANILLEHVVVIMRAFGVKELQLDLVPSGVIPVTVLKFEPLMDEFIPPALLDIRLEVLRGTLKTICERFGVGTIRLNMSDAEMEELKALWRHLETGNAATNTTNTDTYDAPIVFENIKLPVETDPATK